MTARNQAISVEFEKTAQAYAIQKSLSQQLQKTNENLTLEVRELTYTKDECFTRIEQLVTCVDELHHSIETLNENLSNEHKAKLKLEYQVSALEIQVEHANQQIEKLNDQNADLENEVNETSQKFEELLFEHETLIEETEEVNQLMEERFNDEKKRGVLFELIVEAQRSAIEQSSEEVIRLQERMKEIEIARGELKEENEKLEALIAEMRAKNESEAEKSIALNHELRNRNDKLESLVAELRQDNKSLEDKLAFRDSEINLISKRIESKEEMFHENDTRLAVMKQEIEMLAVRNEELKQQNEKLESLMTEMRVDSMREAEKSVAQNQLLKLQNESLESIVAEMRAENEREAEKSAELNQQLKEQNNKLEALVAEMRAENEREAEKSTTLNRLLKDHNDKLEVLVAEIREKNQKEIEKSTVLNQEEIAKFESLIFDSREENQILQEKISFYQLEMKSLCAQRENNLELLQQNEKLHSLISEIKEENANLQRRAELFETKVKSLTSQLEESQLLAEEHQKFLLEAREDNERLHQKIACYEIEMKAICQQMECNEELKRQNEKLGAVIVELREEKERELERVSTQSQDEIELLKKANNLGIISYIHSLPFPFINLIGLQEAAEERMRLTKEIQEANDNLKELHDRLQKIEAENEATKQLNFWLGISPSSKKIKTSTIEEIFSYFFSQFKYCFRLRIERTEGEESGNWREYGSFATDDREDFTRTQHSKTSQLSIRKEPHRPKRNQ